MTQKFDDFESNSIGNGPPTGWTNRFYDDGVNWKMAIQTINSQKSAHWVTGGNPGGLSTCTYDDIGTAGLVSGAVDMLFQFRVDAALTASDPIAVIYGDVTGAATGYMLNDKDGTHWNICPFSAGAAGVAISSDVAFTFATGTDYWAHFGTNGSGVFYAKIWAGAVSSEPGGSGSAVSTSPQATSSTDTTWTSGYCGMADIHYSRVCSYSQFGFGTGGSIAPSATPSATAVPIFQNNYQMR